MSASLLLFDDLCLRSRAGFGLSLLPPIGILESHDVILAKIAANLNLDRFQRNFSRIGEPVSAPDRYVDRFVLVHRANFIVH